MLPLAGGGRRRIFAAHRADRAGFPAELGIPRTLPTCTIPDDKALFFPLASSMGATDIGTPEATLRMKAKASQQGAKNMASESDGISVPDVSSYRIEPAQPRKQDRDSTEGKHREEREVAGIRPAGPQEPQRACQRVADGSRRAGLSIPFPQVVGRWSLRR